VTLFFVALIVLFVRSAWGIAGYVDARAAAQELNDRALLPAYLLVSLMCLAALVMPSIVNRVSRIMVLGVAGAAATGLFYVYQAPDLALTQISIEVVSLLLFLLVLALLPATAPRGRTRVAPRLVLSIGVGVVTGLLTLAATAGDRPPRVGAAASAQGQRLTRLGDYFLRNSYVGRDALGRKSTDVYGGVVDRGPAHPGSFGTHPWDSIHGSPDDAKPAAGVNLHKGGGGANVVNVILVDFRGFDTLGEITVLALAALGVWTLFRRQPGEDDDSLPATEQALVSPAPSRMRMSTTVLLQAARLLVPLALIVSAYVFFKGHQMPGGGFVGGLIASVALILYRMCAAGDALRGLLPVRERTLIAWGLMLAAATGAAALLAGLPFLTSNNGYLPLPGERSYHWATVMFFDAGVFLVVVGVTVGLIDVLSRELELRRQPAQ
jgi:multicomponent K+:H+ antiporter subunit A